MDMDGSIAHQWNVETSLQSYCRLLPDGNLIYPTHDRSDINSGRVGLFEQPARRLGLLGDIRAHSDALGSLPGEHESQTFAHRIISWW